MLIISSRLYIKVSLASHVAMPINQSINNYLHFPVRLSQSLIGNAGSDATGEIIQHQEYTRSGNSPSFRRKTNLPALSLPQVLLPCPVSPSLGYFLQAGFFSLSSSFSSSNNGCGFILDRTASIPTITKLQSRRMRYGPETSLEGSLVD